MHVCARVCVCVYTRAPGLDCQGYSSCIEGLKLPEKGKGERERARRQERREGGERLRGRGRHWEIRELFSALSHQTPTATEGVAEPPARSTW